MTDKILEEKKRQAQSSTIEIIHCWLNIVIAMASQLKLGCQNLKNKWVIMEQKEWEGELPLCKR